uniref:Uncharacterized protein n=1 Tax=Varanus komodoensis TaxID=61221 RepID=A0A8D2L450_VARKO
MPVLKQAYRKQETLQLLYTFSSTEQSMQCKDTTPEENKYLISPSLPIHMQSICCMSHRQTNIHEKYIEYIYAHTLTSIYACTVALVPYKAMVTTVAFPHHSGKCLLNHTRIGFP